MSSAGAYDNSGPQARSSSTIRTMIWNLCLRNDICKDAVHKKLNSKEFLAFLIDYGCNCYPSSSALPATPTLSWAPPSTTLIKLAWMPRKTTNAC